MTLDTYTVISSLLSQDNSRVIPSSRTLNGHSLSPDSSARSVVVLPCPVAKVAKSVSRSLGVIPSAARQARALSRPPALVCRTPLGWPVEPDVYRMKVKSSALGSGKLRFGTEATSCRSRTWRSAGDIDATRSR